MILEDKKYTTGDIARLYGISLDTVRFYEKKGLLLSQNMNAMKYRVYNRTDMLMMRMIQRMRQNEIPIADIESILHKYSLDETAAYYNELSLNLDEKMQQIYRQKKQTQYFCNLFKKIERECGRISVEMSPAFVVRDIQNNMVEAENWFTEHYGEYVTELVAIYGNCDLPELQVKQAEKYMTKGDRGVFQHIYLAIEVDMDRKDSEQLKSNDKDYYWPEQLCIHRIQKTTYKEPDLKPVLDYAETHCFQLMGDCLCKALFREKTQTGYVDYYEEWYPIRE